MKGNKMRRNHLILVIIVACIIIAVPLVFYLTQSHSPTYDESLISTVEEGYSPDSIILQVKNYTNNSKDYFKSILNLENSTLRYRVATGEITQEYADNELKNATAEYKNEIAILHQIEAFRIGYVEGLITKDEFLKDLAMIKLENPEMKTYLEM